MVAWVNARSRRPGPVGRIAGGSPLARNDPHGGLGRLPRAVGGQAGDVVGDGVDGVGEPGAERLRRTRGPQQPVGGRDEPDADREPDEPLGQ